MSFVERHGLWSAEQKEAAKRLAAIVQERKLETIRLSFADQHGILRGKTLIASEAVASLESGCSITTTMLAKDTSHRTVFPVFTSGGGFGMKEMEGAADFIMVPDPTTFRVLPWSPASGWVLCDIYFGDGKPVPFSTRQLYRSVLNRLGERGYDFVAGLEVEFHLFKLEDAHMAPEDAGQPGRPPSVSLLSHGYQYLTEQRYDQMEPALEIIRRDVLALGLPLRSVAHVSGIDSPRCNAARILPRATTLIAMSRMKGLPPGRGTAIARGLLPSRVSAPPVGAMVVLALLPMRLANPASAAISE